MHRVTRAQRFDGPRSFAHFSLFGLVAAGRDRGNYTFELGDGGDVPWTQALLHNHKERLVIGGLGLERLALLASLASS